MTELQQKISSELYNIKKQLSAIFEPQFVEYICRLIAKDLSHQKLLDILEEDFLN